MLGFSVSNVLRIWVILSIVIAVVANPVPQANAQPRKRHGKGHKHHKHGRRMNLSS
jgi:hypothetical protein